MTRSLIRASWRIVRCHAIGLKVFGFASSPHGEVVVITGRFHELHPTGLDRGPGTCHRSLARREGPGGAGMRLDQGSMAARGTRLAPASAKAWSILSSGYRAASSCFHG